MIAWQIDKENNKYARGDEIFWHEIMSEGFFPGFVKNKRDVFVPDSGKRSGMKIIRHRVNQALVELYYGWNSFQIGENLMTPLSRCHRHLDVSQQLEKKSRKSFLFLCFSTD